MGCRLVLPAYGFPPARERRDSVCVSPIHISFGLCDGKTSMLMLRTVFELEDADGVGFGNHHVGGRVFLLNVLHAERFAAPVAHQPECTAAHGGAKFSLWRASNICW